MKKYIGTCQVEQGFLEQCYGTHGEADLRLVDLSSKMSYGEFWKVLNKEGLVWKMVSKASDTLNGLCRNTMKMEEGKKRTSI